MVSDDEKKPSKRRCRRSWSRNFSEDDEKKQRSSFGFLMMVTAAAIVIRTAPISPTEKYLAPSYFDIMSADYTPMSTEFITKRPMGIRYRDDAPLKRSAYFQYINGNVRESPMVMPLVVGRQLPNVLDSPEEMHPHSSREEPTLEDIELIDVLWRGDIAAEKGSIFTPPQEQFENDLQVLTEKSLFEPLTRAESSRYEEMAKGFFEDFYSSSGPGINLRSKTSPDYEYYKRDVATPTDEDLDALLEDVKKEDGQLNQLSSSRNDFLEPVQPPLLNNISLGQGIVYNQNNMTLTNELTSLAEEQPQQVPAGLPSPQGLTLNTTDGGSWANAGLSPNDIYPTTVNRAFPAFPPNETETSTSMGYDTYMPRRDMMYNNYYYDSTVSYSSDSSSSGCSSPHGSHNYEQENNKPLESRYYGKLAPVKSSLYQKPEEKVDNSRRSSLGQRQVGAETAEPRRRGRQSKDEQLAASNNLPLTAKEIAEMKLPDLQKFLKNERLTETQRALIKKIRRRGKNKVAARTCRQRRTDRLQKPDTNQYENYDPTSDDF